MSNSACSKQHRQKPNIIYQGWQACNMNYSHCWVARVIRCRSLQNFNKGNFLLSLCNHFCNFWHLKLIFLCLYLQVLQWANRNADFVLPMYIFDPRHFGGTYHFGFPKTGPHRTKFLLESIQDLRKNLKIRGRLG